MLEHGGEGVGECSACVGCDEGCGGAWHGLKVFEHHGCVQEAFACAASGAYDGAIGACEHGLALHGVEVDLHYAI